MVTVRKMEQSEAKDVQRIGQKAFAGIEKLFISRPKEAMVAVIGDRIVGGIIIKFIHCPGGKIGYLDTAFVDPAYHGQGIGGTLYRETVEYLWEQGCTALSGTVKDDNVGSWKLLLQNGFTPVTLREGLRCLGLQGMLLQYFATPLFACNGMEFYLALKTEKPEQKSSGSFSQILLYLAANALLCIAGIVLRGDGFGMFLCSYILLLLGGVLFGYIGRLFAKGKWRYRLNSGGAAIVAAVSLIGGIYPMIGNWYPEAYENPASFRKGMGITAVFEWGFCLAATALAMLMQGQYPFLRAAASLGRALLLYHIIPVYPFESYGGRRVLQWSKWGYGVMAFLSAAVIVLG